MLTAETHCTDCPLGKWAGRLTRWGKGLFALESVWVPRKRKALMNVHLVEAHKRGPQKIGYEGARRPFLMVIKQVF